MKLTNPPTPAPTTVQRRSFDEDDLGDLKDLANQVADFRKRIDGTWAGSMAVRALDKASHQLESAIRVVDNVLHPGSDEDEDEDDEEDTDA